MPRKKNNKVSKSNPRMVESRMTAISSSFSGPLPPPNILDGYERVLPGSADRIITMAEEQLKHRHNLEKSVIKSNIRNEGVGMVFAFILTLTLMFFGGYLIINEKETAGYFAVFGPVVFHSASYVFNKRKEGKTNETKEIKEENE